jgi:hypothetical protein
VGKIRHPGEVMSLHWIRPAVVASQGAEKVQLTLTARLSGPFQDVTSLKVGDSKGAFTFNAPAVSVSNAGTVPVISTITIPKAAPAGFYNLTFAVAAGRLTSSGASVVQVR